VLYAQPLQTWFTNLLARWLPPATARRIAGPFGDYLLFTLAAQVMTLPVIAYHFQCISLVFILANPRVTEQIVQQCVDLGIKYVWMHCLMGTRPGLAASMTSVSPEAVRMCRENGIMVIPGACPNQFLKADFGHAMMRVIFRTLGFHRV